MNEKYIQNMTHQKRIKTNICKVFLKSIYFLSESYKSSFMVIFSLPLFLLVFQTSHSKSSLVISSFFRTAISVEVLISHLASITLISKYYIILIIIYPIILYLVYNSINI
jgi:hypothetical protein